MILLEETGGVMLKKIVLIVIVFFFILGLGDSMAIAATSNDKAEIKKSVLNYIEGWYEGNAERMKEALHPDFFTKRGVIKNREGKLVTPHLTFQQMVGFTAGGGGKRFTGKKENKITIYDVFSNCATVKAVSAQYIDLIHLGKFDGKWKIVNVIWERNPALKK